MRLWEDVKSELWALIHLSVLMEVDLAAPWYRFAYMGDASGSGTGVIATAATDEELHDKFIALQNMECL